jgi:hypothetical protein
MESSLRIGKKRPEVSDLKKDIEFVMAIVPDLAREVSRENTRPSTVKDFFHSVDGTKTGKPEGGWVELFPQPCSTLRSWRLKLLSALVNVPIISGPGTTAKE